jgi:anti-anti-sigma factor
MRCAVPLLEIDVLTRVAPVVVRVAGEIDLATAGEFRTRLGGAADGDLVVDVAGVQFFSAAGLRVLLHERDRREAAGARLVLVGVPASVRILLRAADVDMLSAPTLADAVAELERPSV